MAALTMRFPSPAGIGALLLATGLWPCLAAARPVHVLASQPSAQTVIRGDHAEYIVRFDGPVDHAASAMQITQAGRLVEPLTPRLDSAVDVLFADGRAPPAGHYLLHWRAVAAEGDVTEGDIPFSVAP